MNPRILLLALSVQLFVGFWPLLFLNLGYFDDWLSYLVILPLILTATSLGVTLVGVSRKESANKILSTLLITVSIAVLTVTFFSLGLYSAAYNWASQDCPGSIDPWKCVLVNSAGYVEIYLLLGLIVPIVTLVSAIPKYYRPVETHRR